MDNLLKILEEDDLSQFDSQELQAMVKELTAAVSEAEQKLEVAQRCNQSLEQDIQSRTFKRINLARVLSENVELNEALCELEKIRQRKEISTQKLQEYSEQLSLAENEKLEMESEIITLEKEAVALADEKKNLSNLIEEAKQNLSMVELQCEAEEAEVNHLKNEYLQKGTGQSFSKMEREILDERVTKLLHFSEDEGEGSDK
ncbi:uncharacterized protein LOC114656113 isoform X2 [Erpetoichthys calabaricus]|uniref:uncharacterized protein LOC114656113 isoform X2 n=1 Tax=Erpetoichthys calabaricus TaxID=27687 RepID=UPI0010A08972|nr:uncharacterized protein LOC114656113 isoform X2 [Erpetoichthys calabaricus]